MSDLFHRKDPSTRRLAAIDSVVVIGLGRFGRSLALELVASGTEVLGIDCDGRLVQELSTELTHCVQADSTSEDALRQLGVQEFDRAVVAIGSHIEASLLTASLLKTLGVGQVWAKAISEAHGRILEQLGISHVVYPEHEMGRRVAHLVKGRMLDFIQFEPDYAMVKTLPPEGLLGIPLSESRIRRQHGVTVVGVKKPDQAFTHATGETVLEEGDTIIISGVPRAVERYSELR
ncbi:MAG: potassium transporter [Frankiales bacterium]|jgi:trk system potassium uptake protein TrkA|nr:potassium transporter [Frankiales bacterium]